MYVWKESTGGRNEGGVGALGKSGVRVGAGAGAGEWEKIKEHAAHGASGEFVSMDEMAGRER